MLRLDDLPKERRIRVFVSSTFLDMKGERDLIARRVGPHLRAKYKEAGIDFAFIDLRWGVTRKQSESGATLGVCLRQIDRCAPYFIALQGSRYGWIPAQDPSLDLEAINANRWLCDEFERGSSITEIEIRYALFFPQRSDVKPLFYFRTESPASQPWAEQTPGESIKNNHLRQFIRGSLGRHCHDYTTIEELEKQLVTDFEALLETHRPKSRIPITNSALPHADRANSLNHVFVGREDQLQSIDDKCLSTSTFLVVCGDAGSGKSALLAEWIHRTQSARPEVAIFYHFVDAMREKRGPEALLRRMVSDLKTYFNLAVEIPSNRGLLHGALYSVLRLIPEEQKLILLVDGIDQFSAKDSFTSINWIPDDLPPNISIILSTRPGDLSQLLMERGMLFLELPCLTESDQDELVQHYLTDQGRELSQEDIELLKWDPKCKSPLFIRSLLDELGVVGAYESLSRQIREFLETRLFEQFFQLVLRRIEIDNKEIPDLVRSILSMIWASRIGLSENEVRGLVDCSDLQWAGILAAFGPHLTFRGDFLDFANAYLEKAVANRYLVSGDSLANARCRLIAFFSHSSNEMRKAQELPWLMLWAKKYEPLKDYVTVYSNFLRLLSDFPSDLFRYWRELRELFPVSDVLLENIRLLYKSGAVDNEEEVENVNRAGIFLNECNEFKQAAELYAMAFAVSLRLPEIDRKLKLMIMSNMGTLSSDLGYYDQARFFHENAVGEAHKTGDLPDSKLALLLHNLATCCELQGDFNAAKEWYTESIARARAYPESLEYLIAGALTGLGQIQLAKGDLATAKEYEMQGLNLRRKIFGKRHRFTSESLNNFGLVQLECGETRAASESFENALEIMLDWYGENHMETGSILNNLGVAKHRLGELEEAQAILEKALRIRTDVLGADHPLVGESTRHLNKVREVLNR